MTHIARSTFIIAIFFAVDKVLGFARQILIGRQFGLSRELDAFNTANNLPDLLFALISGGALAIAVIPVLSEWIEREGRPAAWDVFSRVANLFFLVTALLAVVIAIFAGPLVRSQIGLAPGFTPSQQVLVAELMRLNLVATLIFSLSGLVMAGLQANQHFLLPAMAPALYNVGQIFGAVILAPQHGYRIGPISLPAFGLGVHGLVYGVILGALLHLSIQLPGLLRYKFRWTSAINLRHPGLVQVLGLMGPRLITMLFIQLIQVGRDNFASRLAPGSVTALTYGWFIMQVPETLIGTAIATALLPTLAEQITRGDRDQYRQTINRALRTILALTIPAAALMAVSIRPVIQFAFHFDDAGIDMVAWATRAFLLGLMAQAMFEVVARSFYARQNARTPLLTAGFRLGMFLLFSFLLVKPLGAPGIALADTIAISSETAVLLFLLNRTDPGILKVGFTFARVVPGSLVGAAIVYLIMTTIHLHVLILAAGALAIGGVVLLPFIWPEAKLLVRL